jgi:hypothetical protein
MLARQRRHALEDELYRLEGEIILQNASRKDSVKKRLSQTWLGLPSVDENLRAMGSHEPGFAGASRQLPNRDRRLVFAVEVGQERSEHTLIFDFGH